jgi:glyoxylase-like metal-dependent hydrolase (beta-lactamase superfamily II)
MPGVKRRLNPFAPVTEKIAEGVWRHSGDIRRGMNVYLVAEEDGSGVFAFDTGTRVMASGIREAAAGLGGLTRVVLGHSHVDHRGSAAKLGAPVFCHPDEVADAEGDAGVHYQPLKEIPVVYSRWLYRALYPVWDAGPVEIAGTISEGESLAGFEVVHFPGHAPGQIGLWRESDRLCICSDTVYLTDSMRPLGHHPGVFPPHPVFDHDPEQTLDSLRKLAALEPTLVAPGHLEPLSGKRSELRARLEQAADQRNGW